MREKRDEAGERGEVNVKTLNTRVDFQNPVWEVMWYNIFISGQIDKFFFE